MDWKRMLAYITGSVIEDLLLRNEFLAEENSRLPHSAFRGQTPDEMYFGAGGTVPEKLEAGRAAARLSRVEANRTLRCQVCA